MRHERKGSSKEIVQIARTRGFRSPREILSATNVTSAVYTDNVFALTTYSRSPDLNVFGQPKMALVPILGAPEGHSTNMVINGITLRPVQEIYPTPSQLPGYTKWSIRYHRRYNDRVHGRWHFARSRVVYTLGRGNDFGQGDWFYSRENYCYINGQMLANYLAGTNAAGEPVTWPSFPGASSTGFEKYTPRQIDSIVAQIVSLGSKAYFRRLPVSGARRLPSQQRDALLAAKPYKLVPGTTRMPLQRVSVHISPDG